MDGERKVTFLEASRFAQENGGGRLWGAYGAGRALMGLEGRLWGWKSACEALMGLLWMQSVRSPSWRRPVSPRRTVGGTYGAPMGLEGRLWGSYGALMGLRGHLRGAYGTGRALTGLLWGWKGT